MTAAVKDLLGGVRVAPSILSADFGRLREQVAEILDAGARVIHCDVMDGHFVPPITLGPVVLGALADLTHQAGAMLDVHLMIERPERHIADFIQAGADSITVHAEATPHLAYAVDLVAQSGLCVGVAINPATPVGALAEISGAIDMALCMTINPGWGGQQLIPYTLAKVERVREIVGADVAVEVDGGIDSQTAPEARRAGANVFVAGTAIFHAEDPPGAYRAIVQALGGE